MPKRGFIIAIESYAKLQEGLNSRLPGTLEHAGEFRDWLISAQGVAPQDIFYCTDDAAAAGRTSDATRATIKDQLRELKRVGKDTTEDLYFYFSGHGFCYTDIEDAPTADVLMCSEYVSRDLSGEACLKLDEIQRWLKFCLGTAGTTSDGTSAHFYFIDACRNNVSQKEIIVPPLGLVLDPSVRRKPPVFTLYSGTPGALAAVESGFPEALLDGLNGKGRAKRRHKGSFAVLFDSLRGYLESRLESEPYPRVDGGGDGLIRKLGTTIEQTCAVTVANAQGADQFEVQVSNESDVAQKTVAFSGPTFSFGLPVDDYHLRVRLTSAADAVVEPAGAVAADLYDDCRLQYRKVPVSPIATTGGLESVVPAPRAADGEAPMASLTIVAPAEGKVVVRRAGEELFSVSGEKREKVPSGSYVVETEDSRGVVVDTRRVSLQPGAQRVDLTDLGSSPLRTALLRELPHGAGVVAFSESLGPATPDQGMDLWLALMGAARIVGGPNEFRKLGPLPLASFDDVGPDATAIYVLAGFDEPGTRLRVVVSDDWRAEPLRVTPHATLPGLFQAVDREAVAGSHYLTIRVDDNAPVTVVVCALPRRGTLVTLSRHPVDGLRIQQFILPLWQFLGQLPYGGGLADRRSGLDQVSDPLPLVRRCVDVQRAFARGRELSEVLSQAELTELLYFKWFEPVVALLAAYELMRRGRVESLPHVVYNLRSHFPELPDNEALARLAGSPWEMPGKPPLVLDGYQALDLMSERKALPPSDALAFRGPWTLWRGLTEGSVEVIGE